VKGCRENTDSGRSPSGERGRSRKGKIEDVALDSASGATLELDLRDRGAVAGDRLVGLGAYAVLVAEAVKAP
jgi:hypothetical protein